MREIISKKGAIMAFSAAALMAISAFTSSPTKAQTQCPPEVISVCANYCYAWAKSVEPRCNVWKHGTINWTACMNQISNEQAQCNANCRANNGCS